MFPRLDHLGKWSPTRRGAAGKGLKGGGGVKNCGKVRGRFFVTELWGGGGYKGEKRKIGGGIGATKSGEYL